MTDTCSVPAINDQLVLFLEKRLSPEQSGTVSAHLSACACCTEQIQALEEIHAKMIQNRTVFNTPPSLQNCIPADLLISYADRKETLSLRERRSIEAHLFVCPDCSELIDKLRILNQAAAAAVQPDFGEKRFLEMVSRQGPLRHTHHRSVLNRCWFTLALHMKLLRDRFLCLLNPAHQPVYVRSKKRTISENVTVIQDKSGPIHVKIEIENLSEAKAEIAVLITKPPLNDPLQDLRASLFTSGRESVSLYVTDGRAVFSDVPHDQYALVIIKDELPIKTVQLNTLA